MAQQSQPDDQDFLDQMRERVSNARNATISTDLPALTLEPQSDFISPVTQVEGSPALRNQSFYEDEAPSTDGRIGCFCLCDLRPRR